MTPLSCPEARELVSDYIDGELADATAAALEHHLETCPNCPPLYASLVHTLADLRHLGVADAGDDLAERLAAAVAAVADDRGDGRPHAGPHRPAEPREDER